MLELEGFAIDPAGAYLGLDRDLALSCVTRRALGDRDLAQVTVEAGSSRPQYRRRGGRGGHRRRHPAGGGGACFVLPRVTGGNKVNLEPSFAVVVATTGEGRLKGDEWEMAVKHGDTLVVPWAAGAVKVEGNIGLLRCLRLCQDNAAKDDPGTN